MVLQIMNPQHTIGLIYCLNTLKRDALYPSTNKLLMHVATLAPHHVSSDPILRESLLKRTIYDMQRALGKEMHLLMLILNMRHITRTFTLTVSTITGPTQITFSTTFVCDFITFKLTISTCTTNLKICLLADFFPWLLPSAKPLLDIACEKLRRKKHRYRKS
jgi:hypothetical protein